MDFLYYFIKKKKKKVFFIKLEIRIDFLYSINCQKSCDL